MCREIEASVAGVWNFVAVNQTLPHLCISSFTEKSLHVQESHSQKLLSITPLQYFRSFNWSILWCWSGMKIPLIRGFVRRPSSNIVSLLFVLWLSNLINRPHYRNRVFCKQHVCCHCSKFGDGGRCNFQFYLRKRKKALLFSTCRHFNVPLSSLITVVLFLRH